MVKWKTKEKDLSECFAYGECQTKHTVESKLIQKDNSQIKAQMVGAFLQPGPWVSLFVAV